MATVLTYRVVSKCFLMLKFLLKVHIKVSGVVESL